MKMASQTEYLALLSDHADYIRPIKFEWSIKGYHAFRIRPHEDIPLCVKIETNNPFDEYAMKVTVPPLEEIPQQLHNEVTRQGDRRRPTQRVRDIAGKQIGRVPANLCRAQRILLDREHITYILCKYTGHVRESSRPHVFQNFQARTGMQQHDQGGGGADLLCQFIVLVKRHHFEAVMKTFEEHLPRDELDTRLLA